MAPKVREAWLGATWFFLRGSEEVPGPRLKRMRAKGIPEATHDELELMKKLRTGAGIDRGALVSSLSVAGIERAQLAAAQRRCKDLAVYVAVCLTRETGENARQVVVEFARRDPGLLGGRRVDSVLEVSDRYELIGGVLFRRVWNSVAAELQLRCCVPNTPCGRFEVPGRGLMPLGFRERILLEYHNGALGGHQGRERTMDMLERDFWWPGMYSDVRTWCKRCEVCRGERGSTGISAWTRTELYSCPFRVIQFDTVTCRAAERGAPYILAAVWCFSRWPWLIPMPDRTAVTIA
ncbi:MAG: hypothetical protein GY772_16640, partial [bacterium]|nr:hypothetical protein [bacterium]